jgi:hypothetical protein
MSQTNDEVIRVTKAQPGVFMAGNKIYEAGAFENIQAVYNALSTMHKGDNPALIRRVPDGGGRYEYAFNPDYKFKKDGDLDIAESASKASATGTPRRVNWNAGESSESKPPMQTGHRVVDGQVKVVSEPAPAITIPKFTGEISEQKRQPEQHTNLTPLRARFEAEHATLTARLAEVTKALDAIDTLQKAIG